MVVMGNLRTILGTTKESEGSDVIDIDDEWDSKPILPHPGSVKQMADPKKANSYQFSR